MSAELQWAVIRKTSSFLRVNKAGARDIVSVEKGNVTNANSFKSNGLVNAKTVDVAPAEGGAGVVLTVKTKKGTHTTSLTRGSRRAYRAIRGATDSSFVRPDLTKSSIKKASAILKSQKTKVKKVRRGRKTAA